jgi:hypothetical protein
MTPVAANPTSNEAWHGLGAQRLAGLEGETRWV